MFVSHGPSGMSDYVAVMQHSLTDATVRCSYHDVQTHVGVVRN